MVQDVGFVNVADGVGEMAGSVSVVGIHSHSDPFPLGTSDISKLSLSFCHSP
jgi:hypothetical protein